MASEIIYVTIDETVTEVVDVTVNNLRGPTGPQGLPGPSSVAINDADTNITQTWSSSKINTEITTAVDAVDSSGLSAHIADFNAHYASSISVLDSGDNYTSTDVESVLAEIKTLIGTGGTGTALVIAQDTRPDPLIPDTIWVNTADLTTYLIYDDGTTVEPVQISSLFGVEGPEGPVGPVGPSISAIDGGIAASF